MPNAAQWQAHSVINISCSNHIVHKRFLTPFLLRINLLVGTNNSGKSSILEALELMSSRGSLRSIWTATARRGERLWFDDDTRRYSEGDVSHLFYGHGFQAGSQIVIASRSDFVQEQVRIEVAQLPEEKRELFPEHSPTPVNEPLALRVEWRNGKPESRIEVSLSPRGGPSSRNITRSSAERLDSPSVQFISTAALSADEVLSLFDEIVLTPEEELLVEALRTIEPNIDQRAVADARSLGAPCIEAHVSKANIYTWLAWQDPPGRQLHQAPAYAMTSFATCPATSVSRKSRPAYL